MIKAVFYGSPEGWTGFWVSGHAEYAQSGRDVVCAAVSALTQAVLGGIVEIVGAQADYHIEEEGTLYVRLCSEADRRKCEDVNLLCEVLRQSLEGIAQDYEAFLQVSFENENGGGTNV